MRKCVTFHGSRREAERELTRLLAEVDRGGALGPATLTVNAVLDEWLENRRAGCSPLTLYTYQNRAELYIRPHIGRVRASKLSPAQVEALLNMLRASGSADGTPLGGSTLRMVYTILHAAFDLAVKRGHVARNPVDLVAPPQAERREGAAFTPEELRSILHAARGTLIYPAVLLAAATGCRRGEVLALRWEDVDLEAGLVRFARSASPVPGVGTVDKAPKTRKSARVVPIGKWVVQELRQVKAKQAQDRLLRPDEYDPSGWVVANESGRRPHPSAVTHAFAGLLRSAGIQRGSFHSLRHTQATLLLQQGHNIALVSRRLGHASIGITADIYGHVDPAVDRAAADLVGEALGGLA